MRRALTLLSVAAAAVGLSVAVPAAAGAAGTASLPNSHPTWARSSNMVAATAADTRIGFSVYLKMRDQARAEAVAAAVSDPNSSSYGHYLSPAQVRSRFAATNATVRAVRNWLSSTGLTVGATASNNAYVQASGTAAQIQRAFAVHLNVYSVKGQHRRAVDANLSLPSSIVSSVTSVNGLNQAQAKPLNSGATATPTTVPPPDGFRNAQPCGTYFGAEDRHHRSGVQRPAAALRSLRIQARPDALGVRHRRDGEQGRQRTRPDRGDPRRVRGPDAIRRRARSTRPGTTRVTRCRPRSSPSTSSRPTPHLSRPTSATRPAGTASRRSTWKPYTRWRPVRTSCTSAHRTARTPRWTRR